MIRGMHVTFFTRDADGMRSFFRDKLAFPFADVGGGWLLFEPPASEIGCHPHDNEDKDSPRPKKTEGFATIAFYCDDIEKTVAHLSKQGVKFDGGISDEGYGLVATMVLTRDVRLDIYQPHYKRPRKAKKKK